MTVIEPRITSPVLANALRGIQRTERALESAQDELATGRKSRADISQRSQLSVTLVAHAELRKLETANEVAGLAEGDVAAGMIGLSTLRDAALAVRDATLSAGGDSNSLAALVQSARAALGTVGDTAAMTHGGRFVFGGYNTDQEPLTAATGGSLEVGTLALKQSFETAFGVPPGNAATRSIGATELGTFLATDVASLFSAPSWSTHWSNATPDTPKVHPTERDTVSTAVTAAHPAFRDIVEGLSVLANLGLDALSEQTASVARDHAVRRLTSGIDELAHLEGELGAAKSTLANVQRRSQYEMTVWHQTLEHTEAADPAEVSVRLASLTQTLEATYSAVGRIASLSLLNHLR